MNEKFYFHYVNVSISDNIIWHINVAFCFPRKNSSKCLSRMLTNRDLVFGPERNYQPWRSKGHPMVLPLVLICMLWTQRFEEPEKNTASVPAASKASDRAQKGTTEVKCLCLSHPLLRSMSWTVLPPQRIILHFTNSD